MNTEAIGSNRFNNTYSLLKAAQEEEQIMAEASRAEREAGQTGESALGRDIQKFLSQIPKGKDGKLSFQDVEDYRKKLGKDWDKKVMADLKKLGVDVSKEFPLSYDSASDKVTVKGDHKDKAIIDKYFADNPDRIKEFKAIVQLGKLTATANEKLSLKMMTTNLRLEAMAWWYQSNTSPANWFEGGGMMAMQGKSNFLGLNKTV